jgi:pyruvate/2-oxoglutarate dehydrogenase complex dihydrolipoamide acyltransferase (E2) component
MTELADRSELSELPDRLEPVDRADRWSIDIIRTAEPAGILIFEEVDMTATKEIIARFRACSARVTYTHVITRAAAVALARHPELVRVLLGKKTLAYPGTIDISMSVSSELALSAEPTLVVPDAAGKDIVQIAAEITSKAAQVRAEFPADRERSRKFVKMVPFAFLRRFLIRKMKARISMVHDKIGVFHITNGIGFWLAAPLIVPGCAALSINRVEDAARVRNGEVVVLPTARIGLVCDHRVWKGTEATVFISEIKKILENGELAAEVSAYETNGRPLATGRQA